MLKSQISKLYSRLHTNIERIQSIVDDIKENGRINDRRVEYINKQVTLEKDFINTKISLEQEIIKAHRYQQNIDLLSIASSEVHQVLLMDTMITEDSKENQNSHTLG